MTNFEKYRKDIEETGYRFGYDIKTNKVTKCDLMNCSDCEFSSLNNCEFISLNNCDCRHRQIKWLYEEYIVLTDAEINLINTLSGMTGVTYNFIVRDAYDEIYLFSNIPIAKDNRQYKYYLSQNDCLSISDKTKKLFPNIKYEDGIYDIENKCFIKE